MKQVKRILTILILLLSISLVNACSKSDDQEFESLYTLYQDLLSYSGSSYEELLKRIENLQVQIRSYLKDFTGSEKRVEVERILSEITNMQLKLNREQLDFSELENQFQVEPTLYNIGPQIDAIKTFLENYPKSVKFKDLRERLDQLVFKKFQQETAIDPTSISEINQILQSSAAYWGQVHNPGLKAQINTIISRLESLRENFYEIEFHMKANELLTQMENEVVQIALKAHPASRIKNVNVSVISGDLSQPVQRMTIIRAYSVNMRGALMGINRYRVIIQVSGTIWGNSQSGVSYRVDDAVKILDSRSN